MIVIESRELAEQFLAACDQPFPFGGLRGLMAGRPRREPRAGERDRRGQCQRDSPRRLVVMRHAVHRQLDRLPGRDGPSGGRDEDFPLGRHLALLFQLRRLHGRFADLLDDHGELLEVRRQRLRDVDRPVFRRQRERDCTEMWPGANGPSTVTRKPLTLACGEDPSMIAVPDAPAGTSKTNGVGGFTGRAGCWRCRGGEDSTASSRGCRRGATDRR